MAKTTGVLNSKRTMVSLYLIILTLVGIAIFSLLYLYYQDKNLYTTDIEKYDQISSDIYTLSKEYSKTLNEITLLEKKKIDLTEKYQEQTDLLNELIRSQGNAIQLSTQIIDENERVLELELDIEKHSKAQNTIDAAGVSISIHTQEIAELKEELFVATYLNQLESSLACYSEIDTVHDATAIESYVKECDKKIDNALTMLHERNENFEKSKAYLNEVKNYWDITIELNKIIEARDEEGAKVLDGSLTQSSNDRNLKQVEAEKEFSEFVEGIRSED